ncbi:hypothetical protein MIMGU_mgv1a020696mg [Erythranthe guttata]|uniref:Protein kinase domain-containing protein n=1 Tax=Erythranthe guttata TaxID=4155 RepID=A0A022RLI2_ERYGU|nr:hypothetical protein MIMGU_mgv1a020696mg [Erythranthe guttata]
MIGNFLSFASRGDRVGLNDMLRKGMSPDVQDYDNRTALHLAASEGHASIVELLLAYNANVNLQDRWQRTPLADAKVYEHRDICRILEVNGGRELIEDQAMGQFGVAEKVKWRGTWVVKTVISRHIYHPEKMVLTAKDNTLLRELRHPNILQFLGSIVQGEDMILITEYLPKGNMNDILAKKVRLDPATCLRYALDIARLIEQCTSKDIRQRPSFGSVIEILEEVILLVKKAGCSVC